MRDFTLVVIGAALAALALGVLGLNRAQAPNAAYSAMTLGLLGVSVLTGAAAALIFWF